MNISVVIPVLNGDRYLKNCIQSVAGQEEATEIIVVDDGSSDNTFELAGHLARDLRGLTVLRHADGLNHGRAASRNLGIKAAKNDWIAFLDVDDWYLPRRFSHLSKKREDHCSGYYDPIETFYADPEFKSHFPEAVTGLKSCPPPGELLDYLIRHDTERISLNGLVVRKQACVDLDGFDETLTTGEDTDFIWRLAINYQICPGGKVDPVAVRRVHGQNTYFDKPEVIKNRAIFYSKWRDLIANTGVSPKAKQIIEQKHRYYETVHLKGSYSTKSRLAGHLRKIFK